MRGFTSSLHLSTFVLCMALIAPGLSYAQSSQYKRKETKKSTSKAAVKSKKATNQKLNLDQLEKRYWAPKDTEFKVVQNRKFKKAKRYNVTLMGGVLFNDPFVESTNLSLSTAWYFDEHSGVEVRFENYASKLGEGSSSVLSKGGHPDINFEKWFLGANYTWIPFYGKISVLDSNIIYFDMSVSAGLGMIRYEQQASNTSLTDAKTTLALSLDVTQQFFVSKNWAFRADARTKIYQEDRLTYLSGASLGTKTQVNTYLLFGATYFFD